MGGDWPRKGLVDLLSAFTAVTKLDPSATLDVVTASTAPGSGQPGVRFHGPCSRERVLELLRQCNVLVLPSLAETYGLIVVEALMMSRACVVSDADPLPEIAADGGVVFRAGDPDDLGKQLLRLVAEPPVIAALQRRARERYLERHHPDVFLASFLRCLG